MHVTTCIGFYSYYAFSRFPVFLTIPWHSSDLERAVEGLLIRDKAPFILLAPTRSLETAKMEELLVANQSTFLPMSEIMEFEGIHEVNTEFLASLA